VRKEGEAGGEGGREGWGPAEVEDDGKDGSVERGDLPRLGNLE